MEDSRKKFEKWFMQEFPDAVRIPPGPWLTWQAAEAETAERCAELAEWKARQALAKAAA